MDQNIDLRRGYASNIQGFIYSLDRPSLLRFGCRQYLGGIPFSIGFQNDICEGATDVGGQPD